MNSSNITLQSLKDKCECPSCELYKFVSNAMVKQLDEEMMKDVKEKLDEQERRILFGEPTKEIPTGILNFKSKYI